MKAHAQRLLVAAALLAAVPTFAQNIAIVNGKAVPKARLTALQEQLAKSGRPLPPGAQDQLKEEIIVREIFSQEAQRRGLDGTDAYKTQIEIARQGILIRELLADEQKKNPITDAQARAEYDKFVAAASGKEVRVRHILVADEAQAKSIIAQLKTGAKFDELAKKFSKDPGSGARGGDLDWAPASNYVPEFAAAVGKLSKGQLTDAPVKSEFGWHVIRLEDTRESKAQLPKFEDVKDQIVQQLQQQRLAEFQEQLRAKAKIQ